jgi:hypothetical protein
MLNLAAAYPLTAIAVATDPITTPRAQTSSRSNGHAALGTLSTLGFPLAATIVAIAIAWDRPTPRACSLISAGWRWPR